MLNIQLYGKTIRNWPKVDGNICSVFFFFDRNRIEAISLGVQSEYYFSEYTLLWSADTWFFFQICHNAIMSTDKMISQAEFDKKQLATVAHSHIL